MSSILIRRANMVAAGSNPGRLPAGYTELAYIETDGESAIYTSLLLGNDKTWEIKFQSAKGAMTGFIAGSLNGNTAYTSRNNYSITVANSNTNYALYCDGNAGSANYAWRGGNAQDMAVHVMKYFGNPNTPPQIDGVDMAQGRARTLVAITPSVPWTLFGRSSTLGDFSYCQDGIRIFYFSGEGFNFIPAMRDSDSVVGMYDLVSDTFLTNAGSGTFSYGTL